MPCLERLDESCQLVPRVFGGRLASIPLLKGGGKVGGLNGLEEIGGCFLLLGRRGKTLDGATSFVHVTAQLILDLVPLLLVDVAIELGETLRRLSNDVLLALGVLRVLGIVDRVLSYFAIDRVGGVKLA